MNQDTIEGALKNAGGKIKQATGEAVGNENLANSGAADRVTGAAQETWGKTKDAAHDIGHSDAVVAKEETHDSAHSLRSSIANAAEHVKDSVSRGLDHLKEEHREKELHETR